MNGKSTDVSAHDKRRIAVAALCDARSVDKYLRGEPMRQMLRLRLEAALRSLGFEAAIRTEAAS